MIGLALIAAAAICSWRTYDSDDVPGDWSDEQAEELSRDLIWNLPRDVDPQEFEERYARYFTAEFQSGQAERIDDKQSVDLLHPSVVKSKDGVLGTVFIDNTGKVVLAVKHAVAGKFSEGLAAVGVQADARASPLDFGYVDRTGKIVIAPEYVSAGPFRNGLAAVQSDRSGFINRKGEVVIPRRYQSVEDFHDGMARVCPNHDAVQFIDAAGRVLFEKRRGEVAAFSEGLVYVNLGGQQGYLDRNFEFALRLDPRTSGFITARCEKFHEERAAVELGGNRWGFIDRMGKLVIPASYFQVSDFSEGRAAVCVRRGTLASYGFIDRSGALVIEPRFLAAGSFKEGLAAVRVPLEENEQDKAPRVAGPVRSRWGYLDRDGKLVIGPRFYQVLPFEHGLAYVSENPWHHGYIDKTGNYVWQVAEPVPKSPARPAKPVVADQGRASVQPNIALELRAEPTVVKLGDHPKFDAVLINKGSRTVTIVLPGDGSETGRRTPIVRWKPAIHMEGRCGNINALRASEVVTLRPGRRVPISSWIGGPTFRKTGVHEVVLEIENVPRLSWSGLWLGQHNTRAMQRVRRSTPFKVMSNTVEIRVEE